MEDSTDATAVEMLGSAMGSQEKLYDDAQAVDDVVDVVIEAQLPDTDMSTYEQSSLKRFSELPNPLTAAKPNMTTLEIPKTRPGKPDSVTSEQPATTFQYVADNMAKNKSPKQLSIHSSKSNKSNDKNEKLVKAAKGKDQKLVNAVAKLEPQGKLISDNIDRLSDSVKVLAHDVEVTLSNGVSSNIDKIATMSKALTSEAKALRDSIKCLSEDFSRTKQELCYCDQEGEDVNFPYHLFLIEMIINKIHMKCECFDIDYNNLVISATFLGKQPIILYDSSFGKIENFDKLNVGKSTLFAMTYDKICSVKDFEIVIILTKQPPCSTCVTKIGETHMDYTSEFVALREELCTKWKEKQPTDNILCTTSTPLSKNMYYLSCGVGENSDSIGIIEVTVRMSFLGKEITTAFCAQPKPQGTSFLLKEDHGMTMYSCQRVEMDDQGKILLDENVMSRKPPPCPSNMPRRIESPHSAISSLMSKRSYDPPSPHDNHDRSRYDEIYTKMNVNELKIRIPKSSKIERMGKYDKIQELCSCESTAYNTGEQIQFDLPKDCTYPEKTYTSNLKYTLKGLDKIEKKDRKIVNITPTDCPVPVDMSKVMHPQKDVFILKIGKKIETKDKKTDLEIELVTPKAPENLKLPEPLKNISAQCSQSNIKNTPNKKKGKGKRKDKGKGDKRKDKAKKNKGKKE